MKFYKEGYIVQENKDENWVYHVEVAVIKKIKKRKVYLLETEESGEIVIISRFKKRKISALFSAKELNFFDDELEMTAAPIMLLCEYVEEGKWNITQRGEFPAWVMKFIPKLERIKADFRLISYSTMKTAEVEE